MTMTSRIGIPVLVLAVLAGTALSLDAAGGQSRQLSFALVTGAALGVVLQRARFCFFCNLRDLVEARDPRGVLSILAALAAGLLGYFAIFGMWLPVPASDRLPPTAHIGPVSAALALGALAFGLGMTLAGSCISAHLYRLGEGNLASIFALTGAFLGFVLGFMSWNPLFMADLATGPAIWLPHHLGYAGTLALSLLLLAALAFLAAGYGRPVSTRNNADTGALPAPSAVFVERWPPVLGGVLVGAIGSFAYLRVAPLGVTSQLGTWARTTAAEGGLLPETLYSLDTFRGCATAIGEALLTPNGYLILGLIAGSFAAAVVSGRFALVRPSFPGILRTLAGGILMGWGAMIALGCTVGVLLSGIQAGALAGWIFLAVCTASAAGGIAATRLLARKATG